MPRNERSGPVTTPDRLQADAHRRTGTSLLAASGKGLTWRDQWLPAYHLARAKSADRRQRVLAHPDLAQLLTQYSLEYARPDQWTGYVPPEIRGDEKQPEGSFLDKRNTSERRAALVAICAEALAPETGRSLEPVP